VRCVYDGGRHAGRTPPGPASPSLIANPAPLATATWECPPSRAAEQGYRLARRATVGRNNSHRARRHGQFPPEYGLVGLTAARFPHRREVLVVAADQLAIRRREQERIPHVTVGVTDKSGPTDVNAVPAREIRQQVRRLAVNRGGVQAQVSVKRDARREELWQRDPGSAVSGGTVRLACMPRGGHRCRGPP
jgi:hypothetical protein